MSLSRAIHSTPAVATPKRAYALSIALLALAAAALSVDASIVQMVRSTTLPGEFRKPIQLSETFAHGFGVLIVVIAVYLLDNGNRRALFRIVLCAFGSGLMADVVKVFVGRIRPRYFDLSLDIRQSFDCFVPLLNAETWSHANQSFPSAHSATAFGLAFGLGLYYRQARKLFIVLAIMSGFQRLYAEAHYASDILFGSAIGALVYGFCIDARVLGGWLERFEKQIPVVEQQGSQDRREVPSRAA